jgi:hypothetical protein
MRDRYASSSREFESARELVCPTAEACPAADGTNLRLKTADKLDSEFALKTNCRRGMGVCPRTRNITQVAGRGLPGGRRDQSPPKNGG